MQELNHFIPELGELILQSKRVLEYDNWNCLTVVYDVTDGSMSNSGFIYIEDKIIPISTKIESDSRAIINKIREFRAALAEKTGKKFKQLLVQMENETGRIRVEFDFDKGNTWRFIPSRLKEIKEELRPKFDQPTIKNTRTYLVECLVLQQFKYWKKPLKNQ